MTRALLLKMCRTILELEQSEVLAGSLDCDPDNADILEYTSNELEEMQRELNT